MTISGRARLAGVIGWPVGHSLSPRLHGYWIERHGIDGAYVPLAVRPENIAKAVRALPKLGFAGANVTVPYKESALRACDWVDEKARRIGAVNTLVVKPEGAVHGFNTDGFGFVENLRAARPGWVASAGPAAVVGAGGAARAVAAALIDGGAPRFLLINRTLAKASALARDVGGSIEPVEWRHRADALAGAALLVNTTTLGMKGEAPLDLALDRLPRDAVVTDIVYVPLMTPLLEAAGTRGNPVVDGLGMLLHQARPGFAAWFGVEPEVTEALRAFVLDGLAW